MIEILPDQAAIIDARKVLGQRRLDALTTRLGHFLRRWGLVPGVAVGEFGKGWDVLKTVEFIERNLPPEAPVLDIGAFASEILPILHRLGYGNLTGIDLNPRIKEMPNGGTIRYDAGNFLESTYPDGSFAAITAISVIEHGLDTPRLLREVARLLADGGYFVASFDYWPTKIDTSGVRPFGLSWTIFSRPELEEFVAAAGDYGLIPVGQLNFKTGEKPISWEGREYTFGWLALRKFGPPAALAGPGDSGQNRCG